MSPLETEFIKTCTKLMDDGIRLQQPPVEIISNMNALLREYEGKGVAAGFTGDFATELHRQLVLSASEMVSKVITYEQPISEAEEAVLTFFRNENVRCLPKHALAKGIENRFKLDLPNTLQDLYRKGLLKDGERNITICLTSAGSGFIHV